MVHAQNDQPKNKTINAADPIPAVPFEKAVNFLKAKVPLTKAEWNELEPKLRFRAFTVAKLTQADYINTAKEQLIKDLQNGKNYAQSWYSLNEALEDNALNIKPGYWETVYRTNIQSAYTAGKLKQFEANPPVAYQLMVIEDMRTSKVCKSLLQKTGYGAVLPVNHPFWQKYGFPPYHFNCRTSILGIYNPAQATEQINQSTQNTSNLANFAPQKSFGGNPIEKESWWKMTKAMAFRAVDYGIFNDIEKYANENGLYNFALDLVNGSDYIKFEGTKYSASKAKLAQPLQKEINVAKILEDNGYTFYFTPENKKIAGMKNPDGIINGICTADIKVITSKSLEKIADRIKECDEQKVQVSIIHITNTEGYSKEEAINKARDTLRNGYTYKNGQGEQITKKLDCIKEVFLIYDNLLTIVK